MTAREPDDRDDSSGRFGTHPPASTRRAPLPRASHLLARRPESTPPLLQVVRAVGLLSAHGVAYRRRWIGRRE